MKKYRRHDESDFITLKTNTIKIHSKFNARNLTKHDFRAKTAKEKQ